MSEQDLVGQHDQIMDAVKKVESKLDQHIHTSNQVFTHWEQQQEMLAEVVLGKKVRTYDGEIVRKDGLVDMLNHKGIKVSLPWGKILTALIITIGTIVVTIIQTSGG